MELRERFVCEDDAYNYPARHEVLGKNMENRDPIQITKHSTSVPWI